MLGRGGTWMLPDDHEYWNDYPFVDSLLPPLPGPQAAAGARDLDARRPRRGGEHPALAVGRVVRVRQRPDLLPRRRALAPFGGGLSAGAGVPEAAPLGAPPLVSGGAGHHPAADRPAEHCRTEPAQLFEPVRASAGGAGRRAARCRRAERRCALRPHLPGSPRRRGRAVDRGRLVTAVEPDRPERPCRQRGRAAPREVFRRRPSRPIWAGSPSRSTTSGTSASPPGSSSVTTGDACGRPTRSAGRGSTS